MKGADFEKLIACLESFRTRPQMYLGDVTVDAAVQWLNGFTTSVKMLADGHEDYEARRQVLESRGWSFTARHPYLEMVERGLPAGEVIDELLLIESEVLRQMATIDPSSVRLVEAYRAADLTEAHAIRIALEEAGLQVVIDGEALQASEQLGWATAPRILVSQSQLEAAWQVMAQRDAREEVDEEESLYCLACNQLMEDGEKCSACGWTYAETVNA